MDERPLARAGCQRPLPGRILAHETSQDRSVLETPLPVRPPLYREGFIGTAGALGGTENPFAVSDSRDGMERLWSPVGATGGNRSQKKRGRKRLKQADRQPVATHGNGSGAHCKEGVSGSSPEEGSAKAQLMRRFTFGIDLPNSLMRQIWSL